MAAQENRIAEVYERVAASVVIIDAEGPERTNEEGVVVVPAALATGFVLDDAGHIVTAAHVLEDKTSFVVIFPNGDRHSARPLGDDVPFSDVAVLRIRTRLMKLKSLSFRRSEAQALLPPARPCWRLAIRFWAKR